VKLQSTKQIQGPRSLDRDYIASEKARIATAKAGEADKAANREIRKLAEEEKAKVATTLPKGPKNARGGGQGARECTCGNIDQTGATRRLKFDTEEDDCGG